MEVAEEAVVAPAVLLNLEERNVEVPVVVVLPV